MVFDISKFDLGNLGPERSVELIRKLFWAEAYASEINLDEINVPTAIYVPDGGIDGVVKSCKAGKHGIIYEGVTCYQIKSNKFSSRSIKNILCKKRTSELKDRIRSCINQGGTLVVVFTGHDNPSAKEGNLEDKFKNQLRDLGYKDVKIKLWFQNTLMGFLAGFPSLRLYILGDRSALWTHEDWENTSTMQNQVYLSSKQSEFIRYVRDYLVGDNAGHIRVLGEPGVGKTKLVLEATNQPNLQSCVLYAETPKKLDYKNFLADECRTDIRSTIILVVDECNTNELGRILNILKPKHPRIKLVTIFNELDNPAGSTVIKHVSGLPNEKIADIFEEYGISKNDSSGWVDLCGHSPRAAHMLASNLKLNPDDLLRPLDTVPWDRCIANQLLLDSDDFKRRRTVLLWLSLFRKFGFEDPYDSDVKKIIQIIEEKESIPVGQVVTIINKLREMKILQGSSTLYISPKILHIYLWTRWWTEKGRLLAPLSEQLAARDGEELVQWYYEMFKYAATSPAAKNIISSLLRSEIFFGDDAVPYTETRADFFLILSRVEPAAALNHLERLLHQKTRDELLIFTSGRRQIVLALEYIATFPELFAHAGGLLLDLADAENEACSNNATGIFSDLFSLGTGSVSHTEASAEQRISLLTISIKSESIGKKISWFTSMQICSQNKLFYKGFIWSKYL